MYGVVCVLFSLNAHIIGAFVDYSAAWVFVFVHKHGPAADDRSVHHGSFKIASCCLAQLAPFASTIFALAGMGHIVWLVSSEFVVWLIGLLLASWLVGWLAG